MLAKYEKLVLSEPKIEVPMDLTIVKPHYLEVATHGEQFEATRDQVQVEALTTPDYPTWVVTTNIIIDYIPVVKSLLCCTSFLS